MEDFENEKHSRFPGMLAGTACCAPGGAAANRGRELLDCYVERELLGDPYGTHPELRGRFYGDVGRHWFGELRRAE
jgi:hypothetical protein